MGLLEGGGTFQQDKNQPDAKGLAWQAQRAAVELVRDVYDGTTQLRKKRDTYLPRFPLENKDSYKARADASVLFNALKRTVGGLNGMVFRKDPAFSKDEPVPQPVQDHAENIDLAGRDLWRFARDVGENALLDGHTHILVDMPQVDGAQVRTLADERALRIRPYWINVLKQDLLSFRYVLQAGRMVLVQIAYRETTTEGEGTFGEKPVERVRVYRLDAGRVVFEVWRRRDSAMGADKWFVEARGSTSAREIPLVTVYANRTGFLTSTPPLEDLAHENVLHFRLRSDRINTLHIAGVPIPWVTGWGDGDKVPVASDVGFKINNPEARIGYLEPRGHALSETREELMHSEKRMAIMGLAILQKDARMAETATAARMDKSEGDSILSSFAKNLQAGLNEALRHHARWMGLDDGGQVVVNQDFESLTMSPQMVQALAALVGSGDLSQETLWQILQQGEVLPDDFDAEMELARLGNLSSLEPFVGNGNREPERRTEGSKT